MKYDAIYDLEVGQHTTVVALEDPPRTVQQRIVSAYDRWNKRNGWYGTREARRITTVVDGDFVTVRRVK